MKLNDFVSHMVSLEHRWNGFFANSNYIRTGNSITWPNRIRYDVDTTPDLLVTLIEQRQYSIQVLEDGSVFQIYYAFDQAGVRLLEASLGFYHARQEDNDSLGDPFVEGVIPLTTDEDSSSWIRLDFDPNAATDCLHYHTHLHMSLSSELRIPFKRVPTPKQFVELIIAWFYPETYRTRRLPNGLFQIPDNDARTVFDEIITVQTGIPNLNGGHIFIP